MDVVMSNHKPQKYGRVLTLLRNLQQAETLQQDCDIWLFTIYYRQQ